ncbi:MAG TPA: bifunctional adenosylcobinamide kinase/adenosylcobinamide-phosphate guanylyltransferase [Actinomycetota bacterium]
MSLTLLLGGARSGKSRLAVRLAASPGLPVVVIATGEARDEEMAERIHRHRAERPAEWETIEEPIDLAGPLANVQDRNCVLVDCLTLWVSNLMEMGLSDGEIEERAGKAASLAATRGSLAVAVTNEVGSGIVPEGALARRFADVLGRVNAIWAEEADRALLVVAGRVLPLSDPADVLKELSRG